jgi:hypothetical protein
MKPATMQATDKIGQFIRDQTPPVVLARAFPAGWHSPLRSSETGNQPSNSGGIYDDECLQHTPVHWNFGHAVIWHPKKVWPPERPPLTLWQWLLPWIRPKITDTEKWMRKQLD